MTKLRHSVLVVLSIVVLCSAFVPLHAQPALPALTPPFAASPEYTFPDPVRPVNMRWVAQNGSDSNTGESYATAWKTIGHAINAMRGPDVDTLNVVQSTVPYPAQVELYKEHNGTAERPKVIRGVGVDAAGNPTPVQPSDRPKIIPTGRPIPFAIASQYWIVEHLAIDCSAQERSRGVDILSGPEHKGRYVAIRNTTIERCQSNAIEVRAAKDVLIDGNILNNNKHPNPTSSGGNDSSGVMIVVGSERVHIRGNTANDNSGDGVQCEGGGGMVMDVIIEGNTFSNNGENGIDLKRCEKVDIIGGNSIHAYSSTECRASAIIIHTDGEGRPTKNVLIEHTELYDSDIGIDLGRADASRMYAPVENIVIRRNIVHDLAARNPACRLGIRVQNARTVEVYHNTFHAVENAGLRVIRNEAYAESTDVRIWNNIFSNVGDPALNEGGMLDLRPGVEAMPGFYSDYNLFFHQGGNPVFRTGGRTLSFEQWQDELMFDTTSTVGDPRFKATSGQDAFALIVPNSPALNTARVDQGNAGPNQRCNGGPDKGAIESDCDQSRIFLPLVMR